MVGHGLPLRSKMGVLVTKRKPRGMSEELRILEAKDPKVRKAAQSYEETKRSILEGRSHPMPCTRLTCPWHH